MFESLAMSGSLVQSRSTLRAVAVIVAAGRGQRFGAEGKVVAALAGRPIIEYALDAAQRAATIDTIIVVAGQHTHEQVSLIRTSGAWSKFTQVVIGGNRRQDSVAAGVAAVPADAQVIAIHDAARPLADAGIFDQCVIAAWEYGAAIAAVPVADTLKRVGEDLRISETVSREHLWAAQTPQAFRADVLRQALACPEAQYETFTDEAALLERLGVGVVVVPSSPSNIKVTLPNDLLVAEALLARRSETNVVNLADSDDVSSTIQHWSHER